MLLSSGLLEHGIDHGSLEVEQRHGGTSFAEPRHAPGLQDIKNSLGENAVTVTIGGAKTVIGRDEGDDLGMRLKLSDPFLDIEFPRGILMVVNRVNEQTDTATRIAQLFQTVGEFRCRDRRRLRLVLVWLGGCQ